MPLSLCVMWVLLEQFYPSSCIIDPGIKHGAEFLWKSKFALESSKILKIIYVQPQNLYQQIQINWNKTINYRASMALKSMLVWMGVWQLHRVNLMTPRTVMCWTYWAPEVKKRRKNQKQQPVLRRGLHICPFTTHFKFETEIVLASPSPVSIHKQWVSAAFRSYWRQTSFHLPLRQI